MLPVLEPRHINLGMLGPPLDMSIKQRWYRCSTLGISESTPHTEG
jgi:hypothetical protein